MTLEIVKLYRYKRREGHTPKTCLQWAKYVYPRGYRVIRDRVLRRLPVVAFQVLKAS